MMIHSSEVERALAVGRDLQAWWADVEAGKQAVQRFELAPAFPGGDAVSGFFGEARAGGTTDPYMGYVADYFFDFAGGTPAEVPHTTAWLTDQVEEFALRYWLRTDAWALPAPYTQIDRPPAPSLLTFLDMNATATQDMLGTTNVLRTYKRRQDGHLGEFGVFGVFPRASAHAIVDLRELDTLYAWITLERAARGLAVTLAVPWSSQLSLAMPLAESSVMALDAAAVVRQRRPSPGVLGEFGACLCPVPPSGSGLPPSGVDGLQTGLRRQTLRVLDTGEVRLRTVTIMQRCTSTLGRFADAGAVARALQAFLLLKRSVSAALTAEQVERQVLTAHAIHLRDTLLGTRDVWQQVGDWLDAPSIPGWIAKGKHA